MCDAWEWFCKLALGGAALTLFANGEFPLQLLRGVALFGREPCELGAAGLGGRACAMRLFAEQFGLRNRFLSTRNVLLQHLKAAIEGRELLTPRRHFPGRQRNFHVKPSRHELRVAFGPTTLTCQRPYLTLNLVD